MSSLGAHSNSLWDNIGGDFIVTLTNTYNLLPSACLWYHPQELQKQAWDNQGRLPGGSGQRGKKSIPVKTKSSFIKDSKGRSNSLMKTDHRALWLSQKDPCSICITCSLRMPDTGLSLANLTFPFDILLWKNSNIYKSRENIMIRHMMTLASTTISHISFLHLSPALDCSETNPRLHVFYPYLSQYAFLLCFM